MAESSLCVECYTAWHPWSAGATGTGNTYPTLPAWTAPTVYDYTRTVEIDGQFFFSGTPWDMVARNYSALTLNIANNSTLTQADVFCEPLC